MIARNVLDRGKRDTVGVDGCDPPVVVSESERGAKVLSARPANPVTNATPPVARAMKAFGLVQ